MFYLDYLIWVQASGSGYVWRAISPCQSVKFGSDLQHESQESAFGAGQKFIEKLRNSRNRLQSS